MNTNTTDLPVIIRSYTDVLDTLVKATDILNTSTSLVSGIMSPLMSHGTYGDTEEALAQLDTYLAQQQEVIDAARLARENLIWHLNQKHNEAYLQFRSAQYAAMNKATA